MACAPGGTSFFEAWLTVSRTAVSVPSRLVTIRADRPGSPHCSASRILLALELELWLLVLPVILPRRPLFYRRYNGQRDTF